MHPKPNRGFTLIELLIVIAVIGILAAVTLVIIDPIKRIGQARDAGKKNDIAQIQRALESYLAVNGNYPPNTENDWSLWDCSNKGVGFIQPLVTSGELKKSPSAPSVDVNGCGYYYYLYTGQEAFNGCGYPNYILMVHMEVPEDASMDQVPDCYNQKTTWVNQDYYGVSGRL